MKIVFDQSMNTFRSVNDGYELAQWQEFIDYENLRFDVKKGIDEQGLYDRRNDSCRC